MPPATQGSIYRNRFRVFGFIFLAVCAFYVLGRPIYWHFVGEKIIAKTSYASDCPVCVCDCPFDSSSGLPPGFANSTAADCQKVDPEMQEELAKHSIDLLSEELKIQSTVAEENQQRADAALLEIKKMSSQYQKEAEKCNFGMETCEEAREKAEKALAAERKEREMWETRAKDLGWKGDK